MLTAYEKKEILKYPDVYYIGTIEAKEQRNFKSILSSRSNSMSHSLSNNNGFDRNGGLYKVIVGDHIAYRYEVLHDIDKGAFGQVVKCFDHKTKKEVAVKINKCTPTQHNNTCRAEASMMQRLRDTVCDDSLSYYKDRIVQYYDHCLFRSHYVRVI